MSSSKQVLSETKKLLQTPKIDVARLKTFEGLNDLSDEEANDLLGQLERFAAILYEQVLYET